MSSLPRRDLVTTVGLLVEAANYLQRGIADDLERETGLPGTWFETLVRLHRTPGQATRMNEMAAQVSFPPSSFSRLIDRMEAERLVERVPDPTNRRATLIRATAVGEKFNGWPEGYRAIQIWDNRMPSYFFRIFGRPVRATVCECERSSEPSIAQALHLMNSEEIMNKIHDRQGTAVENSVDRDR